MHSTLYMHNVHISSCPSDFVLNCIKTPLRILLSHLYSRDFSGLRETSVISRNLILQQTTCLISCTAVQHQCFISCTVVQHQCFISCTVVQHQCLISCTVVQHQCLISCTVVKQDTNTLL